MKGIVTDPAIKKDLVEATAALEALRRRSSDLFAEVAQAEEACAQLRGQLLLKTGILQRHPWEWGEHQLTFCAPDGVDHSYMLDLLQDGTAPWIRTTHLSPDIELHMDDGVFYLSQSNKTVQWLLDQGCTVRCEELAARVKDLRAELSVAQQLLKKAQKLGAKLGGSDDAGRR